MHRTRDAQVDEAVAEQELVCLATRVLAGQDVGGILADGEAVQPLGVQAGGEEGGQEDEEDPGDQDPLEDGLLSS